MHSYGFPPHGLLQVTTRVRSSSPAVDPKPSLGLPATSLICCLRKSIQVPQAQGKKLLSDLPFLLKKALTTQCRHQDLHSEAQGEEDLRKCCKSKEDVDMPEEDSNVVDSGVFELQKVLVAPVEHLRETWCQVSEVTKQQGETTRRCVLGTPMFMSLAWLLGIMPQSSGAHAVVPAFIDPSKAPTQPFDPTDVRLRDAAVTFQAALNASTVVEEEKLWTAVIDKYGSLKADWVSDIVSRAYGNRGNARSRQGKLEEALEDYDKSIALAPYAVDPVLNRGVVLESLGRYDEASADYEAVLRAQPNDPAAWNNLGNVKAAENRWDQALKYYSKAVQLAPVFSFAAANYALALYQVGRENEAVKQFRALLRKYPEFPDMRAALAVSLYTEGLTAEAESNWARLQDGRYRDRDWVRNTRRWPPRLVNALEAFLDVKSSTEASS